jgi:NadR type nicotinamide-nucleotide adenylyltransferase
VTEFRHGLIVGKFYPPHNGHLGLIADAARRCEQVTVVVAANSQELIGLADRVRWVAWECARWPGVTAIGTVDEHPIDYEAPAVWDLHEAVFRAAVDEIGRGAPVDAVFTGEGYGDELARRFAATHIRHYRDSNGPSGTRLRGDLCGCWHDLIASARVDLARRIVVLGAESTGTTTLACDLALALGAGSVAEYGRAWSAAKLAGVREAAHRADEPAPWMDDLSWGSGEFTAIAAKQTAAIDSACLETPIVVADTDALATSVWHERYVGGRHLAALELARARPPDLYILTSPDGVPFDQDGLRDGERVRSAMHERFVGELDTSGVQWIGVAGSREERVRTAMSAAEPLLPVDLLVQSASCRTRGGCSAL